MSDLSPAARVRVLREALDWASTLLAAQPEPLRQTYLRAAATIAHALTSDAHSLRVTLPNRVVVADAVLEAPRAWVVLNAGNLLTRLRRQPVGSQIVAAVQRMTAQRHATVATIARLTAYAAAQELFAGAESADVSLAPLLTEAGSDAELKSAKETVEQLCRRVRGLRWSEALYPGWSSDDAFNETYARVTARLASAGRTLALWQTRNMIDDLHRRWQQKQFMNGLILHIPYLDERVYEMAVYRLTVVPSARIPFHPEFLAGACRLAQRDVRASERFSQATRWQLLSQLDLILHTFDSPADRS